MPRWYDGHYRVSDPAKAKAQPQLRNLEMCHACNNTVVDRELRVSYLIPVIAAGYG